MKAGDNPFAPGRLERVFGFDPVLSGTSWPELEDRWRALGSRAAVTGPRGSGKSALLRAWARRNGEVPVLFFNEQRRRLGQADHVLLDRSAGGLLIVDGEDYLAWRDRRTLRQAARKAAGVLVARHRTGRWPELRRLSTSAEMASSLLEKAVPGDAARFFPGLPDRLKRCHGNLRDLWLGLYDEAAAESFCKNFRDP